MTTVKPSIERPSPGVDTVAAAVAVHGVSKRYPSGTRAVDDVSLTVAPGAVTGLLGHNGAGKTTLIRLIAGLLRPDTGRISVFGHDPSTDGVAVRAQLGVLPAAGLLDLRMTTRENLRFAGDLFGVPRAVTAPVASMNPGGEA